MSEETTEKCSEHGDQKVPDTEERTEPFVFTETLCEKLVSVRWIVAYYGCICLAIMYALRMNLGIAMICMVPQTRFQSNSSYNQTKYHSECLMSPQSNNDTKSYEGDIEWDNDTQGWILSSLFYGYIITQVPGGYLAGRFGGKRVILVAMVIYGAATLLIPFAARYDGEDYDTSAILVIILRVISGLASGVILPAIQGLWGQWAPRYESSKMVALGMSGIIIGTVVMLSVGGFLCSWTQFDGGWPSMFYIGGSACLLFCIPWQLFIYDTPSQHPRISADEKRFIMENKAQGCNKKKSIPWKEMMKSGSTWAVIVGKACSNFGNYTLITKLPQFMNDVLMFDIKSNGLYSTLPFLAKFVLVNIASHVIDVLRSKSYLSTTTARKLSVCLAFMVPAVLLIAVGHVPCYLNYLTVAVLTVAVAFSGFTTSGILVNPQDLAPMYAAELSGVSNTISEVSGIIAPLVVTLLTPNGTPQEWQAVFYIWAGIFFAGAIFFLIFGDGELQKWSVDDDDDKQKPQTQYSENQTQS